MNATEMENATGAVSEDQTYPLIVQHANALRSSYVWVLAAVGFPGNAACLVTVLSMPVTTATFYVALLAVSDSLALLTKLIYHQLHSYDVLTGPACALMQLPGLCGAYANWVLALICFERFFAVCFPLKKMVWFTKTKVYISAGVLALALLFCFSPTFFFSDGASPDGDKCLPRQSMMAYKIQFWEAGAVGSLYFFLPFLLVAIFTTAIIVCLQINRRARQNIVRSSGSAVGGTADGSVERALSIMMACAGLLFLALTLPACLYHLWLGGKFSRPQDYVLYQVVTVLLEANHAVNFLVYFVSAARFRSRFLGLLRQRCLCRRHPDTASSGPEHTNLTEV